MWPEHEMQAQLLLSMATSKQSEWTLVATLPGAAERLCLSCTLSHSSSLLIASHFPSYHLVTSLPQHLEPGLAMLS